MVGAYSWVGKSDDEWRTATLHPGHLGCMRARLVATAMAALVTQYRPTAPGW